MDYKEDLRILIDIYFEENDLDYLSKEEKKDLIDYSHNSLQDFYEKDVNKTEIDKMINQLLDIVYIPKVIEELRKNLPIPPMSPKDKFFDAKILDALFFTIGKKIIDDENKEKKEENKKKKEGRRKTKAIT